MPETLAETWRHIIVGETKSWVLFEHGTCVILMKPEADLVAQASVIMREWGPVFPGSPAGDFTVVTLTEYPGWIVTGHHPDMLNYVAPHEFEEMNPSDAAVGLLGRAKRDQDAVAPNVVHIEDKRSSAENASR